MIDFDKVKEDVDKSLKQPPRKSVDALAVAPSGTFLCFIELKSWEMFLAYGGSEDGILKKATEYSVDLPIKLSESMGICRYITGNPVAFDGCSIMYVLVSDISVEEDGVLALNYDLAALAGTSSNLKQLCNSLSQRVMDGITNVETRYWECRKFDANLLAI